jgi:hypothetical protein
VNVGERVLEGQEIQKERKREEGREKREREASA